MQFSLYFGPMTQNISHRSHPFTCLCLNAGSDFQYQLLSLSLSLSVSLSLYIFLYIYIYIYIYCFLCVYIQYIYIYIYSYICTRSVHSPYKYVFKDQVVVTPTDLDESWGKSSYQPPGTSSTTQGPLTHQNYAWHQILFHSSAQSLAARRAGISSGVVYKLLPVFSFFWGGEGGGVFGRNFREVSWRVWTYQWSVFFPNVRSTVLICSFLKINLWSLWRTWTNVGETLPANVPELPLLLKDLWRTRNYFCFVSFFC